MEDLLRSITRSAWYNDKQVSDEVISSIDQGEEVRIFLPAVLEFVSPVKSVHFSMDGWVQFPE